MKSLWRSRIDDQRHKRAGDEAHEPRASHSHDSRQALREPGDAAKAHQSRRQPCYSEKVDHPIHRQILFKGARQWLRQHEQFDNRKGQHRNETGVHEPARQRRHMKTLAHRTHAAHDAKHEHELPCKRIESPIADVVNTEEHR